MLRVRPSEARTGMRLALPVYHPTRPGAVLIRAGLPLERKAVARLQELSVPEVWIECPKLKDLARTASPGVQAARAHITHLIAGAFDSATKRVDPELDYKVFRNAIASMLSQLGENQWASLFVAELAATGKPAVRHATDVAFLSTLIGLRLDFYLLRERPKRLPAQAKDVTNLGVAAMLHDIGMTRLDEGSLHRWNTTHDESDERWQEHAKLGYRMVSGRIEPTAAAAVLHHHQRFDGSGFPARAGLDEALSGSDIHIYARIIAAADMYDRLVHGACDPNSDEYGPRTRPAVRALNMIQGEPFAGRIDPIVLWGLLNVCPAYPPGSIVRLSDGMRCAVAEWDPAHPCRPKVTPIGEVEVAELVRADPRGKVPIIDLAAKPELSVVEVDGEDVSEDNFELRSEDVSRVNALREMPESEAA
ncbi:MAG: c-di-GMP phosphodiesterase [Phycisphaeraceae bacterium]|nr:MAG: c-di-GMP phosphodiesterase [Phycisphaeraceae bacterium]